MGSAPKPVNMPVMMQKEFDIVKPPAGGQPITIAVYSFLDKTGQRRPQQNIASLSTAVTQGSETFLIKALGDVGNGRWFKVVERVGIDGLTRERQLIRQMREAYDGANAKTLPPMTFAGILLEGGIVGYDSSVKSGGMAARWLGIGPQTQYSEDIVTVGLRAISVSTGEVLAAVTVQKTIVSASDSIAAMKFFDVGTQAFEFESGLTINEPATFAVKSTIEMAVLELIKEGARKGIWAFSTQPEVQNKTTDPVTKPMELAKYTRKMYLNQDTYVYSTKSLNSQQVWYLKQAQEVLVADFDGVWVSVLINGSQPGYMKSNTLGYVQKGASQKEKEK
jgi:curli production assembly/transport component CsgG